jgi:hypothetical protein
LATSIAMKLFDGVSDLTPEEAAEIYALELPPPEAQLALATPRVRQRVWHGVSCRADSGCEQGFDRRS